MKEKKHIIQSVTPGSIAEELELEAGDAVLAVNDSEIEDIFDYQFLTQDSYIEPVSYTHLDVYKRQPVNSD